MIRRQGLQNAYHITRPELIFASIAPGVMNCDSIDGGPKASLWIIHPSRLLRECLAAVLCDGLFRVESIDPDRDPPGAEAASRPDAAVMDLDLPRPVVLRWLDWLKGASPQCKVILLARAPAGEELWEYLAAGADGCVVEAGSVEEFRAAIQRVLDGEMFCSPAVIQSMFRRLAEARQQSAWFLPAESTSLTCRELEILRLVAQHLSNKEIARKLKLSLYTVKNHIHNIVEKLCVESRYQAVEYARRRRWLPAEIDQG